MLNFAVPSDRGRGTTGFPVVVIRDHVQLRGRLPERSFLSRTANVPQIVMRIKRWPGT
ncbi:hypothetical protein PT2222_510007 [Paraburkholderia tropica]